MNTHLQMNKLLVSFALEELSEAEANQVRTHLSQCEMCRRDYNRLKTLLDSVEHVGQLTTDENIYESARQNMRAAVETNYQKPIFPAPNTGRGLVWRIIMKSRITKLATAAVVMIAGIAGFIALIHNGAKPAYAVEQTIEAMRKIDTIHASMTGMDGDHLDVWIQPDPETGENDFYYMHDLNKDIIWLSTPTKSYYYEKKANFVRITDKPIIYSGVRFGRFMEDLNEVVKSRGGTIVTTQVYDTNRKQDIIVLTVRADIFEAKIMVDPSTKLPVFFDIVRNNDPGTYIKTIDSIAYNEPLPEGIFDFQIPEGATVIPVTFSEKYRQPGIIWTIDQTIKVLEKKNIDIIYVAGIRYYAGGDSSEFEAWGQLGQKKSSNLGQCYDVSGNVRWEEKGHFSILVLEKDNMTCTYDIDQKTMTIRNGLYKTFLWMGHNFFKNLKNISQGWTEEYGIDEETGKDCVFVTGFNETMSQSWRITFDIESKLPVKACSWTNAKFAGKPAYECDKIIYNPKLPEGIFDFVILEGVKVIDERDKIGQENN